MPLNHFERKSPPQKAAQFKVVDCFTYLGIQIVPCLEDVVEVNYKPLVHKVQKSMDRW